MAPPPQKPAVPVNGGGKRLIPLIFTALQFVAFACAVIGTPVAWFLPENRSYVTSTEQPQIGGRRYYVAKDKSCYTLWGYKQDCSKTKYNSKTDSWGCGHRKNNMIAACVFAIASIILTLAVTILGLLIVLNIFKHRFLMIIACAVSDAVLVVCWACPLDVYNSRFCKGYYGEDDPGYTWKSFTNLGPGFILMVIACGLQTINGILAPFL